MKIKYNFLLKIFFFLIILIIVSLVETSLCDGKTISSTIPHGMENINKTIEDFKDAGIMTKEIKVLRELSDFEITMSDRIFHEVKYQRLIIEYLSLFINKDAKLLFKQIKKIHFRFEKDNINILIEQRLLKSDLINIPGEINLKIKTESPNKFRISLKSLNIGDVNIVSAINLLKYFRDKFTNTGFENEYFFCELFTDIFITVKPALIKDYLGINGDISEIRIRDKRLVIKFDLK